MNLQFSYKFTIFLYHLLTETCWTCY